jgi:hypothetical protein
MDPDDEVVEAEFVDEPESAPPSARRRVTIAGVGNVEPVWVHAVRPEDGSPLQAEDYASGVIPIRLTEDQRRRKPVALRLDLRCRKCEHRLTLPKGGWCCYPDGELPQWKPRPWVRRGTEGGPARPMRSAWASPDSEQGRKMLATGQARVVRDARGERIVWKTHVETKPRNLFYEISEKTYPGFVWRWKCRCGHQAGPITDDRFKAVVAGKLREVGPARCNPLFVTI